MTEKAKPKKRKSIWFLAIALILLIGARMGLSQFFAEEADLEKQRAIEWLQQQQAYDPSGTHANTAERVKKQTPTILVNKFSTRGFLIRLAGGPVVRVGLDASVSFDQATKIAFSLNNKCLAHPGASKTQTCTDGVNLDESAWADISACPPEAKVSKTLPGWKVIAPKKEELALYCTPAVHCKDFPADRFGLTLSVREPSNSVRLGDVFDLLWREAKCVPQADVSKVEKAFVTSN